MRFILEVATTSMSDGEIVEDDEEYYLNMPINTADGASEGAVNETVNETVKIYQKLYRLPHRLSIENYINYHIDYHMIKYEKEKTKDVSFAIEIFGKKSCGFFSRNA